MAFGRGVLRQLLSVAGPCRAQVESRCHACHGVVMGSTTDGQLRDGLRRLASMHHLPELDQVASVVVDHGVLISVTVPDDVAGRAWAAVLGLEEVEGRATRRTWSATWTDERSGWLTTWQVEAA